MPTEAAPRSAIAKWLALSGPDKVLVVEALFCLATARLLIVFLSFRHIGRLASCIGRKSACRPGVSAGLVARLARFLPAIARRVPWRAKCYETGLAAHFMLRRRGIPSVLYYGAAQKTEGGLSAHVWVRAAGQDVVGCEIADRFAVLVTFPAESTISGLEAAVPHPGQHSD